MKKISTNVVFRPILAEISTILLPWVSQNDEKFSHSWPNFGQIFIKNAPFFSQSSNELILLPKKFGGCGGPFSALQQLLAENPKFSSAKKIFENFCRKNRNFFRFLNTFGTCLFDPWTLLDYTPSLLRFLNFFEKKIFRPKKIFEKNFWNFFSKFSPFFEGV